VRNFASIFRDVAHAREGGWSADLPRFHLRENVFRADDELAAQIADAPAPFWGHVRVPKRRKRISTRSGLSRHPSRSRTRRRKQLYAAPGTDFPTHDPEGGTVEHLADEPWTPITGSGPIFRGYPTPLLGNLNTPLLDADKFKCQRGGGPSFYLGVDTSRSSLSSAPFRSAHRPSPGHSRSGSDSSQGTTTKAYARCSRSFASRFNSTRIPQTPNSLERSRATPCCLARFVCQRRSKSFLNR
jgi:hypothetical protein